MRLWAGFLFPNGAQVPTHPVGSGSVGATAFHIRHARVKPMARDIPQHSTHLCAKHAHKTKRQHKQRDRRGSSTSRGYNARWERHAKAILRANPLCEYCLARGQVTQATVCDHDLPHNGDTELFWRNTFTALCKWDHDSTKQRMERKYSGDDLLREVARMKTPPGGT